MTSQAPYAPRDVEEFKTDHSRLAARVLNIEFSIAEPGGRNTILGAIGGGLMSVSVSVASPHRT
jgi:hypothetical protein